VRGLARGAAHLGHQVGGGRGTTWLAGWLAGLQPKTHLAVFFFMLGTTPTTLTRPSLLVLPRLFGTKRYTTVNAESSCRAKDACK
jgi:hypothetical protein